MSGFESDLVRDAKLETTAIDGAVTCHVVLHRDSGRRQHRAEEIWERKEKIGSGTFGVVWLESCLSGRKKGTLRAIKEVVKNDLTRNPIDYGRELQAMAKFSNEKVRCFKPSQFLVVFLISDFADPVDHQYVDHFVKLIGWFESETVVFIAMEYLAQGDLSTHLRNPFPESESQGIILQLIEGLNFMHENGFSHRDLKPSVRLSLRVVDVPLTRDRTYLSSHPVRTGG
jgi:serine/threonine protein kinase